MASQSELAIFAFDVYQLSDANFIDLEGWQRNSVLSRDYRGSGFDGDVFYRGDDFVPTEIVISFRGTDGASPLDWTLGNLPAAGGYDWGQVYRAIELVADAMGEYPGVPITLTGHSLGGGLASLLATFFGLQAHVFDPAPFELSAIGMAAIPSMNGIELIPTDLVESFFSYYALYQRRNSRSNQISEVFEQYRDVLDSEDRSAIEALFAQREANITGSYLSGEVLESLRDLLPTIVSSAPDALERIDVGQTTLDGVELHSMLLLTAMHISRNLARASRQEPALVALLLDETLYASKDGSDVQGFLNRLITEHMREEAAPGQGILDRFAEDVIRLGTEGTSHHELMRDALISLVVEYYRFSNPASTDAFIGTAPNSITFDGSGWAGSSDNGAQSGRGRARLLDAVVALAESQLSGEIRIAAERASEWRIHSGTVALATSGTDADEVQIGSMAHANYLRGGAGNDLLINGNAGGTLEGGAGDDVLIGGTGADLLHGGEGADSIDGEAGDDSLIGGAGSDQLYGGSGVDNYNFFFGDGSDVIFDSDGAGFIFVEGVQVEVGSRIGANTWLSTDGQLTITRQLLTISGSTGQSTLVIRDTAGTLNITIRSWEQGQLGISLAETDYYASAGETAGDATPPPLPPSTWPEQPIASGTGWVTSYLDFDNVIGSVENDRLFGLGGNDGLVGGAGDDYLDGGEGNDLLFGGAGRDLLTGGEGSDFIVGDQQVRAFGDSTDSESHVVYVPSTGIVLYHGLGWGVESIGESSTLLYGVRTSYIAGDADIIDAGGGNDFVVSGDGDDVISGGDGDDQIFAQAGDDTVQGGAGDDKIIGDGHRSDLDPHSSLLYSSISAQGRDVLYGGDGADLIVGGGNDDRLYGEAGDDILYGDHSASWPVNPAEHGNDLLDGGAGNDFLTGSGGNDVLYGGDGADNMRGDDEVASLHGQYHGSDILSGDAGDDTMKGGGGADRLFGGAGNDVMFGDEDGTGSALSAEYQGDDYLDGGADDDRMYGGGGADRLLGGTGNDVLFGDQSGVSAQAHGGDYIDGGEGVDQIFGDGGSDTLLGGEGDDYIEGDSAEDRTPFAVHGADHIDGGGGNDRIFGWGGDDYILGGSGADQLIGDAGTDVMSASYHGKDYISGGAGNDTLWGMGGDDVLYGNEDDDQLDGDNGSDTALAGNDYLDGGSGNDQLWGRGGHDVLIGGIGNDHLFGNEGNDRLLGDAGDDQLSGGDGDDELIGGAGADIMSGGSGNDTYILSSADIQVSNGYRGVIEDVSGFDTVILLDASESAITLASGPSSGDVLLRLGQGQEINLRNALGGSIDEIVFGDGSRSSFREFAGRALNEQVTSYSEQGGVVAFGGRLDDSITSLGDGAVIAGGRGDDVLAGGADATTTYLFELGDGSDLILDGSDGSGQTPTNVIQFGAGVTSDSLRLEVNGIGGLRIYYGNQGDNVRLQHFSRFNSLSGARTIDEVRFADGSALSWSDLLARGFDVVNPGRSATLDGTDINDRITGNDTIGEWISGYAGDDVIDSGGGNDHMSGGAGSDLYLFGRGDGVDVINNDETDDAIDTLLFDADITADDVTFARSGNSLVARILGTTDRITVLNYFTTAGLDEVRFANGDVLTPGNITITPPAAQATEGDDLIFGTPTDDVVDALDGSDEVSGDTGDDTLLGGAGDDILRGEAGFDVLEGGSGHDTLYGGSGNDVLRGGAGADILIGDAGSDTFLVHRGDGEDVIRGVDADSTSIDVLRFAPGILPDSLRVSQRGTTLLIRIYDPTLNVLQNEISIEGYFSPGNTTSVIDEIRFDDAPDTVLRRQDIQDLLFTGTDGDDVLTGTATNESLRGLAGDDSLSGLDGDDVLDGGAGNDQLSGGAGNDTYHFLSGNDRVTEASGTDRIVLGGGILPSDIQVYRHSGSSAGDLVLVQNGGPNQLRIISHFTSDNSRAIEQVEFSDGTIWDAAQIAARTVNVSGSQNAQAGTTGNDVFLVDHVGDTISESANGGTDTVESSVSYTLSANVENLTLTGLFNLDATGNSLANTLRGNANINVLDGRRGADTLIGGAGDDIYIVAGAGDAGFESGWSNGSDDVVQELADEGYDTVLVQAYSATLSDHVERMVALEFTGSFAYYQPGSDLRRTFRGNSLDNVIDVTRLNDYSTYSNYGTRLDGGEGADTMMGGELDDTYVVDNAGDVVIERGSQLSVDTVETSMTYVLSGNLENLRLTGSFAISGTGNVSNNILDGSTNSAANVLTGQAGDDSYTVGAGDSIVELADEGTDGVTIEIPTVRAYQTSEFANIEWFALGVAAGESSLIGGASDEMLIGNRSDNTLVGGAGNDRLIDTTGSNSNDSDILLGGEGNDSLTTRGGYDRLDGGSGDDQLHVDSASARATIVFGRGYGHDVLNFVTSSFPTIALFDDLSTSDLQFVREGADLILSIVGESSSLRISRFFINDEDYELRSGAPSLRFESGIRWSAAVILARLQQPEPSEADDYLVGSGGADNIVALAGDDVVCAGAGDDIISGGNGSDVLWGEAGADILDGGSESDSLYGGAGADVLISGTGNDRLRGDAGSDTYRFEIGDGADRIEDTDFDTAEDSAVDEVVFGAGIAATDIRLSLFDSADLSILNLATGDEVIVGAFFGEEAGWDRSDHIERIRFADGTTWDVAEIKSRGAQAYGTDDGDVLDALNVDTRLYGLAGNDTLNGGMGNDLLDGGAGADRMVGGAGNDTYFVDNTSDIITEAASGGTDSVEASGTFTLSSEVENLTLIGTGAINGTGNASNNILIGNSGNNTLRGSGGNDILDPGSAGTDTLIGGTGNDTYIVTRSTGITITENTNEGTDTIRSSVTYSVASLANVENLTLTGAGAINATGNSRANILMGNAGNNTLSGAAGNDTLIGGDGADIYSYSSGHGADIIDNSSSDTAQDRLHITNLTRSQTTFTRATNDLVITRNGTATDNLRVLNWFTVAGNQLDFVQFSDQTMTSAQINALFGSGGTAALSTRTALVENAEQPIGGDAANLLYPDNGSKSHGVSSLSGIRGGDYVVPVRGRHRTAVSWLRTHRLLDQHLSSSDGEVLGDELGSNSHLMMSGGNTDVADVTVLHPESRHVALYRASADFGLRARLA